MSVLSRLFFKDMYELLIGEWQTVHNNWVSVEQGSTVCTVDVYVAGKIRSHVKLVFNLV